MCICVASFKPKLSRNCAGNISCCFFLYDWRFAFWFLLLSLCRLPLNSVKHVSRAFFLLLSHYSNIKHEFWYFCWVCYFCFLTHRSVFSEHCGLHTCVQWCNKLIIYSHLIGLKKWKHLLCRDCLKKEFRPIFLPGCQSFVHLKVSHPEYLKWQITLSLLNWKCYFIILFGKCFVSKRPSWT